MNLPVVAPGDDLTARADLDGSEAPRKNLASGRRRGSARSQTWTIWCLTAGSGRETPPPKRCPCERPAIVGRGDEPRAGAVGDEAERELVAPDASRRGLGVGRQGHARDGQVGGVQWHPVRDRGDGDLAGGQGRQPPAAPAEGQQGEEADGLVGVAPTAAAAARPRTSPEAISKIRTSITNCGG